MQWSGEGAINLFTIFYSRLIGHIIIDDNVPVEKHKKKVRSKCDLVL